MSKHPHQTSDLLGQPPDELRASLRSCLNVARWVDEVVDAAPFDSPQTLVSLARAAATPLSPAEIDEALAEHPRIGEKPQGTGAAQTFSRTEQESADSEDERVNAAIAEANREYEQRFGRVFLIRAKGRTRAEILSELHRRLALPPDEELAIVAAELRDIAMLRLSTLLESSS